MNQKVSRRSFFKTSLQAGLAASSFGALEGISRAIEPIKRPGSPRLRVSCCAYSLRNYFTAKDPAKKIDMFQFIDYAADHGCDGVELTSYYFPKPLTEDYLHQVRRKLFLRGIVASGTSVGNDFTKPADKIGEEIALAKKWVDHAVILGAPYVRVFAGGAKQVTPEEAKKNCIAALKECCDYAGKKGIFLGLENHHGIVAEPEQIIDIVKSVDSPWLGINLDTANFQTDDPYADLTKIAPYAINVHFKGEIHPRGHKEPVPSDLPRQVKLLRDANYQGFCALEYEGKEDAYVGVPKLLEEMKKLMAV